MHDHFADWYRLTTPGFGAPLAPDLLERRWEGVEAVCTDLADGEEINLVRLLLKPLQPANAYLAKFRAAFKKADAAFPYQGNDLEIAVLAGATIVERMEESPWAPGDRAGLAVLCASGVSTSALASAWPGPLVAEVEQAYTGRCAAVRGPAKIIHGHFNTKALQNDLDAFVAAFGTADWAAVQTAGKKGLKSLVDALTTYSAATSEALDALEYEQRLRQEETAILWWMTGEYSRDLDRRLADVQLPAAALVAGKELADLVSLPGPISAKAFLDRVLASCGPKQNKQWELKAAVNALPDTWRAAIAEAPGFDRVKDLCPVLGAAAQSLTTDGADDWLPLYRKAYQREATCKFTGVELAHQTYREWLLIRSAADIVGGA